jgi:filamentous hemagglutinin
VIGLLLGPMTNMSMADREARENLVNKLVAGIATASGGNAATATSAAQIEVENNQVSSPGHKNSDPLDAIKIDLIGKYCALGNACTDLQIEQILAAQHELAQSVNSDAMGAIAATGGVVATAGAVVLGPEVLAAYKAAQTAYSLNTAALTGAGISGITHTGMTAWSSIADSKSLSEMTTNFGDRFSFIGLMTASTIGALTGVFGASMFKWAEIPNKLSNAITVPGVVIRANGIAMGQVGGRAAQGAIEQHENRETR